MGGFNSVLICLWLTSTLSVHIWNVPRAEPELNWPAGSYLDPPEHLCVSVCVCVCVCVCVSVSVCAHVRE